MAKLFDPCDRCPAYYKAKCEEEGKVHSRLCLIRVLIYECWAAWKKKEVQDG